MNRKTALKILDKLTPLGLNVVLVAVADPTYGSLDPDRVEGEPDYQIELSRNNALTGEKIADVIDELKKLDVTIEFPQMTVYTAKEVEAKAPPVEPVLDPETPPVEPTDPVDPEAPTEPTPEDPVPAPVEASPTTDDVVASGHDDPRPTET